MACGCGKAKMARPAGSTPTPTVQQNGASQTSSAKVVAAASPYTTQQNKAPAHLQQAIARRTV